MIEFFTDPFASQVAQRALVGGLLAATIASLVGTWVVVRGMAFFGDALAHGVLPGLAIAAVVGFSPTLGAAVSALVMVLGINLVRSTSKLSEDTSIGLLFVGMLALGVVILSRPPGVPGALTNLLFGDVLGVSTTDIAVGAVMTILTGAVLFVGHRAFLALAVSPEKAEALGMRPRLTHAVLLTLLAVSVVVSFRVVGTLLVFGLLIAPPATAVQVVSRIPRIMAVSVLFGWLAVIVGIIVGFHLDTAASATIVVVAVLVFFVVLAFNEISEAIRRRSAASSVIAEH